MNNENQKQPIFHSGCLVILGFFVVVFLGIYYYAEFVGDDCVRSTIDGTVHCRCDMPTRAAWDEYLEVTKGGYEAVVVEGKACK